MDQLKWSWEFLFEIKYCYVTSIHLLPCCVLDWKSSSMYEERCEMVLFWEIRILVLCKSIGLVSLCSTMRFIILNNSHFQRYRILVFLNWWMTSSHSSCSNLYKFLSHYFDHHTAKETFKRAENLTRSDSKGNWPYLIPLHHNKSRFMYLTPNTCTTIIPQKWRELAYFLSM